MSYTPTEWATGDVITAEKLNNIEQGIVGGERFVITATNVADENTPQTVPTLDKTTTEILEAFKVGKVPLLKIVTPIGFTYLTDNVTVMFSDSDIDGVIFTFNGCSKTNGLWHIEQYEVYIYSDTVMSKFIETDLRPAS